MAMPSGFLEIAIIGFIVLVLFGSKLPSTMRSLGLSFTEFKKGLKEGEAEAAKSDKVESKSPGA